MKADPMATGLLYALPMSRMYCPLAYKQHAL